MLISFIPYWQFSLSVIAAVMTFAFAGIIVSLYRESLPELIRIGRNGSIAADEQSAIGDVMTFSNLVDRVSNTGGLELYFVNEILDNNQEYRGKIVGLHCSRGIAIAAAADGVVLAHEVGHALGMRDVYPETPDAGLGLLEVRRELIPNDWNNGCLGPVGRTPSSEASSRYYKSPLLQSQLIRRLLMNGMGGSGGGLSAGIDIPYGSVYGFDSSDVLSDVDTGAFSDTGNDNTRAPCHQ